MRSRWIPLLFPLITPATLAAQEAAPPPSWNVTVGGGAMVLPRYTGSDEQRVFPFPMTQVTYRNRVFLGPSPSGAGVGLGAWVVRTARVGLAADVGFLEGRPASRAGALAGMEDRDAVATASLSVSYRVSDVEAGLNLTQGLNGGSGLLAGARVGLTRPFGRRLIASAGLGGTLANARQMRRDFAVSPEEASRRQALIDAGDTRLRAGEGAPYAPGGGLRHLSASLSLMYLVSPRWALMGFGGVDRLSDEAAASPLVRRREQATGGLGLGYRL